MKIELVTQAEFARKMGINRSQVSRAVATGRISYYKDTKKINWHEARILWEVNRSDNLIGKPITKVKEIRGLSKIPDITDLDDTENDEFDEAIATIANKSGSLLQEKIRKERAQADRLEMKLLQEKGELIAKKDVTITFVTILVGLKNSIISTPERIVGEISAAVEKYKTNPEKRDAKIYEILKSEHSRILNDVTQYCNSYDEEVRKIVEKHC